MNFKVMMTIEQVTAPIANLETQKALALGLKIFVLSDAPRLIHGIKIFAYTCLNASRKFLQMFLHNSTPTTTSTTDVPQKEDLLDIDNHLLLVPSMGWL